MHDPDTATAQTSAAPIFVVGFPRSGTTLTQSLIGAHPRIAAPPEMRYFGRIVRRAAQWGDLTDDANLRTVIEATVNSPRFADCGFDVDRIFALAAPTDRSYGAVLR